MDFCLVYSSVGLGDHFVSLGGCKVVGPRWPVVVCEPQWLSDCWPRWPVVASLGGFEIVGLRGQLLPASMAVRLLASVASCYQPRWL